MSSANRWSLCLAVGLLATSGCTAEADDLDGAESDIVGGQAETDPAYAAVVALSDRTGVFCSGALIAPRVVVTAEHCTNDLALRDFTVRFGPDANRPTQKISVKRVLRVTREGTGGVTGYGADVAFLFLSKTPKNVAPLPMLERSLGADDLGIATRLVGYGQTVDRLDVNAVGRYRKSVDGKVTLVAGRPHANALDPATVPPASGRELLDGYEAQVETTGGFNCVGDSGGPHIATVDGIPTVVALSSAQSTSGNRCTTSFSVVSSFGPEVQAVRSAARELK